MPDPVRGTLSWQMKEGRPLIEYPTKKGTAKTPVPRGQLASDLGTPKAEPQEVDLELENGQPRRIRRIGEAWPDAVPPPDPKNTSSGPQAVASGFHNPYGFVRTRDRGAVKGELGDHMPPSHGCFAPELWSGRIGVKLTVETPLLIPDAAEVEEIAGHKTYPVRMAPDGKSPYLPPTSVKGMLRAAYEAVTNSRLGVFTGHDGKLGYRMGRSRMLHPDSPEKLLDDSLKPAKEVAKLSPADRVFGWVKEGGTGPSAYRGNLRVGPCRCETAGAVHRFELPLPLAILGQPKPKQARFYLMAMDDRPLSGKAVGGAYNAKNNRLQGRKAYPHHAKLDPGYWDDAASNDTSLRRANGTYQEYRRAGALTDDQNRSVTGWIKPGTVFAFDIHITNLSNVELGALLWLLDLPVDENRVRFHRLGGGKPLGFGSVRLERTDSALASGSELARYYAEFALAPPPAADTSRLNGAIADFKTTVTNTYDGIGKSFEKVPFIADFLVAAEGFRDQRPIHYPRVGRDNLHSPPPSPKGENFKWFQKNEQGGKKGLAPLSADSGLPLYTEVALP